MLNELKDIAPTSIYQEFQKAINKGKHFSEALQYLADFNILKELFPEIARMIDCQHSHKHHQEGDVWNHTKLVVDHLMKHTKDDSRTILFYAALLHDIGKPLSSTWCPKKSDYTTIQHEKIGSDIAEPILNALGVPIKMRKSIVSLIKHHMLTMSELKDTTILKKADQFKTERISWEVLMDLVFADELGTVNDSLFDRLQKHLQLFNRIDSLGVYEKPLDNLIEGRDLINLGLRESPNFGKIIREIRDKQLAMQIKTREEALDFAKRRVDNIKGVKNVKS
jgi:tRNA nucleotidyltransferase/poly(A) polymerase